jgi:hypothetical protein
VTDDGFGVSVDLDRHPIDDEATAPALPLAREFASGPASWDCWCSPRPWPPTPPDTRRSLRSLSPEVDDVPAVRDGVGIPHDSLRS